MPMYPTRPFSKASVGGAAVVVGKPDLGYNPAEINAQFRIRCVGLDGGTYTVNLYSEGIDPPWEHQAGAGEDDAVLVDIVCSGFQIVFSGLGGSAAPVVHVRGSRRV